MRRDGNTVLVWTAAARDGFAAERWLAPGDYEVVVTADDLHGSARFTVGSEAGPPVVAPVRQRGLQPTG